MLPLLVGVFALAAVALIAFEVRRIPSARRPLRVGTTLLVVVALLLLTRTPGSAGRLNVLTPGAPAAARTRDAVWLSQFASPALLWSGRQRDRQIHLSGWGLLPHEWPPQLPPGVRLNPAPLPRGVTRLSVPTELGLGERLVVKGQLTLDPTDSAWVCLDDPAGPRDSVRVGGPTPAFEVGDWPRAVGRVAYRLRVRAGPALSSTDTIGIAVRDTRPPSVLIVDGSPSFESTYLKRWLADRSGRVTVRTTLSRERFRTERINQDGGSLTRLTGATFADVDLVLIDGAALRALTPSEQNALRQAVVNEGLGLLITADVALAAETELGRGMAMAAPAGAEDLNLKPVWDDVPRRSPVAIAVAPQALNPRLQPLVRDGQGRLLAGAWSLGKGRLGATLLRTPSRWMLEGEGDLFAGYWQLLLASLARDTVTRLAVGGEGPLRAQRPVTLRLTVPYLGPEGEEQWPGVIVTAPDGVVDTVSAIRDALDPREWTGQYWPRSAGWHVITLVGGREVPFRVSNGKEWIGLEAAARRLGSAARIGTEPPDAEPSSLLLWSRLLLFVLLVAGLTLLWVEPRLTIPPTPRTP